MSLLKSCHIKSFMGNYHKCQSKSFPLPSATSPRHPHCESVKYSPLHEENWLGHVENGSPSILIKEMCDKNLSHLFQGKKGL